MPRTTQVLTFSVFVTLAVLSGATHQQLVLEERTNVDNNQDTFPTENSETTVATTFSGHSAIRG